MPGSTRFSDGCWFEFTFTMFANARPSDRFKPSWGLAPVWHPDSAQLSVKIGCTEPLNVTGILTVRAAESLRVPPDITICVVPLATAVAVVDVPDAGLTVATAVERDSHVISRLAPDVSCAVPSKTCVPPAVVRAGGGGRYQGEDGREAQHPQ